jgi:two-component system response regulator YesN
MYRLLIVEDEPVMRQGLIQLLTLDKYGYLLCGEAENGTEAIKLIDEYKPHIVITDIKMPKMDGLEMIRQVKESGRPHQPRFIILSGYNDFDYARNALRYGVVDYLLKPVDEDELIALLLRIAEQLKQDDRDRFTVAARQSLVGQWNAEDDSDLFDSSDIMEPGPYRYVSISLNEAFLQRYRGQINEIVDNMDHIGIFITLLDEDGADFGLLLTGEVLLEIGEKWEASLGKFNDMLCVYGDTEMQPDAYFCIGEQVDHFHLLRSSYRSAKMIQNFALHSKENILVSDHVKDQSRRFRRLPEQSFKLLLEAIETTKPDQIEQSISQIFEDISTQQLDHESIRAHLYAFGLEVSGQIAKLSGYGESSDWEEDFFQLCNQPPRKLLELKQRFLYSCLQCAEHLYRIRSLHTTGVIVEIERYVHKQYRHSITLKDIAKMNYLHPIYLGQLFKKTTGFHFKDYLHKVRIDEAKLLLRRSDQKVYEIASFVGYSDPDYFVDKFKKFMGMTPSQYREDA